MKSFIPYRSSETGRCVFIPHKCEMEKSSLEGQEEHRHFFRPLSSELLCQTLRNPLYTVRRSSDRNL